MLDMGCGTVAFGTRCGSLRRVGSRCVELHDRGAVLAARENVKANEARREWCGYGRFRCVADGRAL